ncbi:uncharacterized protein PG998_003938 [Apiospora kogelbergensis]|uniref:uncharacterized protein n=1 Tax=Apiospora kogelbergensis TaxID=1337665 RepID=UPI00312FA039
MVSQWDTKNNLRLAMALLMVHNEKLDFNDWKGASSAIGKVFKGDKSVEACRQQWRKLHKEFLNSLESDEGKEIIKAAPKPRGPRKRTSVTRDAQGNGAAEPSPKKPRHAVTKNEDIDDIKVELDDSDYI